MVDILKQANLWNIGCLVTTVLALIFLSLGEWLRRIKNGKYKNFPSGTLVIILGILASKWFDLPSMDIPNVGLIQLNLNNPTIPDLPYSDWVQLFEIGVALVFILYAESYGSIRVLPSNTTTRFIQTVTCSRSVFQTSFPVFFRGCR